MDLQSFESNASIPTCQCKILRLSKVADAFLHRGAVTTRVVSCVIKQGVCETRMPEIGMVAPRRARRTFVSRRTIDRGYHDHALSVVALRSVLTKCSTTEVDSDAVPEDQIELGKALGVNEMKASVAR